LDEIRSARKIVALCDASSTSYFVYKGVAMGFEYELLSRFADNLGVALEMKVVEDMDCITEMLENGDGDIIAANYTITEQRKQDVAFSIPILKTRLSLIQKLPENWHQLGRLALDTLMVRDLQDLGGKSIHVRDHSSFYEPLIKLNEDYGVPLTIESVFQETTEELIQQVMKGEIAYTVADENVAILNKAYYPSIDIKTTFPDSQLVGWACRKNAPELVDTLNFWLESFMESRAFAVIHAKYYKARTQHKKKVFSKYSSLQGAQISEFDAFLKVESERIQWDWRLLAAMIKKESNFKPLAEAKSGASGLMQLIPSTAAHFGADSIFDPVQNIHAGVSFLDVLNGHLIKEIPDSSERVKFILAAYNAGLGHIRDAQRLAKKYDHNPHLWAHVSHYLEEKAHPEFYRDPVVKHGYCRGYEPVQYVDRVLDYYNHYKNSYTN
jgi:membrane-bound lytic murein transglycosylase F